MTSVSHITISPTFSYLAHLIPVNSTPSPAHTRRFKPRSPLNRLLTHVILVRVACDSYIRRAVPTCYATAWIAGLIKKRKHLKVMCKRLAYRRAEQRILTPHVALTCLLRKRGIDYVRSVAFCMFEFGDSYWLPRVVALRCIALEHGAAPIYIHVSWSAHA